MKKFLLSFLFVAVVLSNSTAVFAVESTTLNTTFNTNLNNGGPTRIDNTPNPCRPIDSTATLGSMLNWASCTLIKSVVPLLFSIAIVGFIWGMIQFFLNPNNEEKRKKGKDFMIWGIITLFVMVSMWGLVGVLTSTFGLKTLLPQLSQ